MDDDRRVSFLVPEMPQKAGEETSIFHWGDGSACCEGFHCQQKHSWEGGHWNEAGESGDVDSVLQLTRFRDLSWKRRKSSAKAVQPARPTSTASALQIQVIFSITCHSYFDQCSVIVSSTFWNHGFIKHLMSTQQPISH